MSHPIRVLIADDHPIVRDGLRLALDRRDDIDVVGEAPDGREAVETAMRVRPDVALIDLDMPKLDGVGTIAEIRRVLPACRCVVLSLHEDSSHLRAALAAGAVGYLVKGSGAGDIEQAVRTAASGHVVLGAQVAEHVTHLLATTRPRLGGPALGHLSDRELDLLSLLATGADNAAIARTLHLSPKTIRNQLTVLFARIGVADRAAAGDFARRHGLGR